MARIRTIKPEFFQHEGLFDMESESRLPLRLAFAGLWTQCDREGRFKWRPRTLKAAIFPFDEIDFSRVLDALATGGFVVKYASGGEDFGYVPSWKRNQFINGKEQPSNLPNPSIKQQVDATMTCESRANDATATNGVKEGKGKGGKEVDHDSSFDGYSFDDDFDGSEWALMTFKAYPKWGDPDATVAPARLSDVYMETIEREAPSRGGRLKAAEWFLAVTREFAKQSSVTDQKFIMQLEKFLRQGYVEVKLPRAIGGKHVPKESDEELSERLRREARERQCAAMGTVGSTDEVSEAVPA